MKVERSSKRPNLPEREMHAPIFHPIGPSQPAQARTLQRPHMQRRLDGTYLISNARGYIPSSDIESTENGGKHRENEQDLTNACEETGLGTHNLFTTTLDIAFIPVSSHHTLSLTRAWLRGIRERKGIVCLFKPVATQRFLIVGLVLASWFRDLQTLITGPGRLMCCSLYNPSC
jgi:hypothetical protein